MPQAMASLINKTLYLHFVKIYFTHLKKSGALNKRLLRVINRETLPYVTPPMSLIYNETNELPCKVSFQSITPEL